MLPSLVNIFAMFKGCVVFNHILWQYFTHTSIVDDIRRGSIHHNHYCNLLSLPIIHISVIIAVLGLQPRQDLHYDQSLAISRHVTSWQG